MPLPKPHGDEEHDAWMERCMGDAAMSGEYDDPKQRYAVCQGIWDDRKNETMSQIASQHDALLNAVSLRGRAPGAHGSGIGVAAWHLRQLAECGDDIACLAALMPKRPGGPHGAAAVQVAIKEAAGKLCYVSPDKDALAEQAEANSSKFAGLLPAGVEAPPHTLMVLRHVLTTPREDRDKDVLRTSGAVVDTTLPLLWQHIHTAPIGRKVATLDHDESVLRLASVIVDVNELAHDAAVLVEAGVLRFSHGFRALEFYERKRDKDELPTGFEVTKFEVMEESLVSVPSNVEAQVELWSRGKLKSDLAKSQSKRLWDARTKQASGLSTAEVDEATLPETPGDKEDSPKPRCDETCKCARCAHENKSQPNTQGNGSGNLTQAGELTGGPPPAPYNVNRAAHKGDTLRWNKSLSTRFDVELEHLEPSTLEYDWVSRFLRCQVKQVFKATEHVSSVKMGSFLTGLNEVTADFEVVDTRNIAGAREEPPHYEVVQLNSTRSSSFLVEGIRFLRGTHHDGPGFDCVIKFRPAYHGLYVTCYTTVDKRDKNAEVYDKTWAWYHANNFLKGEAFSLSGEFLPRTAETWGDVFLEAENEKAVKRAVAALNKDGKQAANRGMLFLGPPGTGKTLSGRILKNEAQATFVWVSARDFWYIGTMGGLTYAFDMAKSLAPSVLFIEDVDNWLYETATDYLKSEMDGIGRSSGVTTILTTNYPERLPEALIDRPGRFHDVLKFGLPGAQIRTAMLRKWLPEIGDVPLMATVKATDGWSGAHLYHLAQFAKTLREEEEEETLDGAVEKAVAKIREQRELITESQASGSRYQPRKEIAERLAQKAVVFRSPLSGKRKADESECPECGGEMAMTCKECGYTKEKGVPSCRLCNGKGAIVNRTEPERDSFTRWEECPNCNIHAKAGRTLSKANETKLRDAADDLAELAKDKELTRGQKALVKSAKGGVDAVLASLGSDDDTEKTAEPFSSLTPSEARTLVLEATPVEEFVAELSRRDWATLRRVRRALDAVEAVEARAQRTKDMLALVGEH